MSSSCVGVCEVNLAISEGEYVPLDGAARLPETVGYVLLWENLQEN